MIAVDFPPALPARFAASCDRCPDWEGTPRTSNLLALADFDRHAARMHRRLADLAPDDRAERVMARYERMIESRQWRQKGALS